MSLQPVNFKNPSLSELGLLKENVKGFGLGWDLLSFDYVKFHVNGFEKKKEKVANIANDKEGLWFCCDLLLLIDNKILKKEKEKGNRIHI